MEPRDEFYGDRAAGVKDPTGNQWWIAIAESDKVVYRTTLKGTHTGEFMGIPPTGKSVIINDFTLLRIAEGKIVEWWYDCNLLAVMQQLGLMQS